MRFSFLLLFFVSFSFPTFAQEGERVSYKPFAYQEIASYPKARLRSFIKKPLPAHLQTLLDGFGENITLSYTPEIPGGTRNIYDSATSQYTQVTIPETLPEGSIVDILAIMLAGADNFGAALGDFMCSPLQGELRETCPNPRSVDAVQTLFFDQGQKDAQQIPLIHFIYENMTLKKVLPTDADKMAIRNLPQHAPLLSRVQALSKAVLKKRYEGATFTAEEIKVAARDVLPELYLKLFQSDPAEDKVNALVVWADGLESTTSVVADQPKADQPQGERVSSPKAPLLYPKNLLTNITDQTNRFHDALPDQIPLTFEPEDEFEYADRIVHHAGGTLPSSIAMLLPADLENTVAAKTAQDELLKLLLNYGGIGVLFKDVVEKEPLLEFYYQDNVMTAARLTGDIDPMPLKQRLEELFRAVLAISEYDLGATFNERKPYCDKKLLFLKELFKKILGFDLIGTVEDSTDLFYKYVPAYRLTLDQENVAFLHARFAEISWVKHIAAGQKIEFVPGQFPPLTSEKPLTGQDIMKMIGNVAVQSGNALTILNLLVTLREQMAQVKDDEKPQLVNNVFHLLDKYLGLLTIPVFFGRVKLYADDKFSDDQKKRLENDIIRVVSFVISLLKIYFIDPNAQLPDTLTAYLSEHPVTPAQLAALLMRDSTVSGKMDPADKEDEAKTKAAKESLVQEKIDGYLQSKNIDPAAVNTSLPITDYFGDSDKLMAFLTQLLRRIVFANQPDKLSPTLQVPTAIKNEILPLEAMALGVAAEKLPEYDANRGYLQKTMGKRVRKYADTLRKPEALPLTFEGKDTDTAPEVMALYDLVRENSKIAPKGLKTSDGNLSFDIPETVEKYLSKRVMQVVLPESQVADSPAGVEVKGTDEEKAKYKAFVKEVLKVRFADADQITDPATKEIMAREYDEAVDRVTAKAKEWVPNLERIQVSPEDKIEMKSQTLPFVQAPAAPPADQVAPAEQVPAPSHDAERYREDVVYAPSSNELTTVFEEEGFAALTQRPGGQGKPVENAAMKQVLEQRLDALAKLQRSGVQGLGDGLESVVDALSVANPDHNYGWLVTSSIVQDSVGAAKRCTEKFLEKPNLKAVLDRPRDEVAVSMISRKDRRYDTQNPTKPPEELNKYYCGALFATKK